MTPPQHPQVLNQQMVAQASLAAPECAQTAVAAAETPVDPTPMELTADPPPATTAPSSNDQAAAPELDNSAAAQRVSGDALEEAIAQLCEMGFERAQVEWCLELAHGNPNRAAEYLMGETPEVPRTRNPETLAQDLDAVLDATHADRAQAMEDLMVTADDAAAIMAATGNGPDDVAAIMQAPGANSVARMLTAARAAVTPTPARHFPPTGWEVRIENGWTAWQPYVAFRGEEGEEIAYSLGHHRYTARITSADTGVQLNTATGTERPLRRAGALWTPPVPGECGHEALPPPQENETEFVVNDWSSFEGGQAVRSEPVTVGDFTFKLLVFPRGSVSTRGSHVSVFVEGQQPQGSEEEWCFPNMKYIITVVNWIDYRRSVTKTDTFCFQRPHVDRGWHDMVRVSDLSLENGWLGPNGSLLLRAAVKPTYALTLAPTANYSSRQRTGHVNLQSPGDGWCFTTSLLHSIFHISPVRDLVLSDSSCMDVDSCTAVNVPETQDLHATKVLQDIFSSMQSSETAVPCGELLGVLGSGSGHLGDCDVNSLLKAVCDCLLGRAEAAYKLFEGELESYVECMDINHRSVRAEKFLSLPLSLRNSTGDRLHGIEASLDHLLAEELLEGDNAYEAEGHGKQRARKGLRMKQLPPVLWLDLKRCELDLETMAVSKSNSRFEFPEHLDLTRYATGSCTYALQSVVVHEGDASGGHCHVYVRPDTTGAWLRIDNSHVLPSSSYAAVEANYGGSYPALWNYFEKTPQEIARIRVPKSSRPYSACLLCYIHEDS